MVAGCAELLTLQPFNATTFPNDEGYDELIIVRAIPFHSLCMHHTLPFHGVAHIGYLPGEAATSEASGEGGADVRA
jgi:GTP cyclohydrolase I